MRWRRTKIFGGPVIPLTAVINEQRVMNELQLLLKIFMANASATSLTIVVITNEQILHSETAKMVLSK